MAQPNLTDPSSLPPWLTNDQGFPGLDNAQSADFLANPQDLLSYGLARTHQDQGNPFTKYLMSNLGGNTLGTLYQLVAPPNLSGNATAFSNFGQKLLDSFYNPNTQAPAGLNFNDPTTAGNVLKGLIDQTGTYGASVLGSALSAGSGIDAATAYNEVGSLVDTLGSFNMSSLARTIAKNQLTVMWGNFLNSGNGANLSADDFRKYLASNASDWLYRNFGIKLGGSNTDTNPPNSGS